KPHSTICAMRRAHGSRATPKRKPRSSIFWRALRPTFDGTEPVRSRPALPASTESASSAGGEFKPRLARPQHPVPQHGGHALDAQRPFEVVALSVGTTRDHQELHLVGGFDTLGDAFDP